METSVQSSFIRFISLAVLVSRFAAGQSLATFGDVIPLSGPPADIVLDEARQRLYLVSTPGNRVDVYDYLGTRILGSIEVGQAPLGAALSMDGAFLYVANHDNATLSVIDLTRGEYGGVSGTVSLPAKPSALFPARMGGILRFGPSPQRTGRGIHPRRTGRTDRF